jgi:ribonuclease J
VAVTRSYRSVPVGVQVTVLFAMKSESANDAVKQWFDDGAAKPDHIHTSGHASSSDLREFAMAMKPTTMVPIHGVKWDEDQDGFPPITRLRDGEPLCL